MLMPAEAQLLILALISPCVLTETFHVTPSLPPSEPCPSPCHTLDQYAQNSSLLTGYTDITLVFLRGEHNLSYNLSISNISNLSMLGPKSFVNESTVMIVSRRNAGISLSALTEFEFHYINMRSGRLSLSRVNDIVFSRLGLELALLEARQAKSLSIEECYYNQSPLEFIDIVNISVYNTTMNAEGRTGFSAVSLDSPSQSVHALFNSCRIIGGYTYGINSTAKDVHILIENTHFMDNILDVFFYNSPSLIIADCVFENSDRTIFVSDVEKVSVSNSRFSSFYNGMDFFDLNVVTFTNSIFEGNGGSCFRDDSSEVVLFQNCTFSNLASGLVFVRSQNVTITSCSVVGNEYGIASDSANLNVFNTSFDNNAFGIVSSRNGGGNSSTSIYNCLFTFNNESALSLIDQPIGILVQDCVFQSNTGSPITAYQSDFELRGHNIFQDNLATTGGGLSLYNSTETFGLSSDTAFINNTALEYGGAIYIVSLPTVNAELLVEFERLHDVNIINQPCFYSYMNILSFRVTFANNTARFGGLTIYGPSIYSNNCEIKERSNFVFEEDPTSSTLQISSEPTRACFCVDNVPQCDNQQFLVLNETRYPGETFTTSLVLTGYLFGTVSSTLYTNVIDGDYHKLIGEGQHLQAVNNLTCSNVSFTVKALNQTTKDPTILVLTTHGEPTPRITDIERHRTNIVRCSDSPRGVCTAKYTTPIYLNVTLEDCPLGFEVNDSTGMCTCYHDLAEISEVMGCEIRSGVGYITREGTVWVGVDAIENNTDLYYWHRFCPTDYCDPQQLSVDLTSPDVQCLSNRAGIVCGKCQPNYSLQLGGNKCVQCTNSSIALIIAFGVLGILLVALIKLLDLTVAVGTINGLLFYANVVWRYNGILFTFKDRQSLRYYIITLPIAWINLDFGIETCFSENLDQLTKSGLQFVFPVYIWCIAGFIILVSRWSSRATRLFGTNSVAILGTLFLLSYGKLVRNIIDVFTYADISDSNGTTHKVWSIDGNVQYGDIHHIILILVAIVFLVFFWLPFTLALLLVPFLKAKSNLRGLRWINTLKPFFDAFYGPFKDKRQHQVWAGILLVARVVILIVFAATSSINPFVNILLMVIISTLMLVYTTITGLLYKEWYKSVLEALYLCNLMILGGAFLFYQTQPQENELINPVAASSVCIALFQFCCTVVLPLWQRILTRHLKRKEYADIDTLVPSPIQDIETNSIYDSSRYKEPLLADIVDDD